MIPALLATFLFAFSSVSAKRSVQYLGSNNASFLRILLATVLLATYAHIWGAGLRGPGLPWFIASGFIGYGICDTAIFLALPRLGAQLTSLMVQCLAAPIAAITEWVWHERRLESIELLAGTAILIGVATALFPGRSSKTPNHPGWGALALGFIAAAGQAWGAVLSAHGQHIARDAHQPIDGISVAYQRILSGAAFVALWWWTMRLRQGPGTQLQRNAQPGNPWPWVIANVLTGPSLGVSCYQWALQREATGVVLAITALTPLAVIPLAYWFDKERPTKRSLGGGVLAVAGVITLALRR
jgi:drug/metabolite transporter (DMT)-like permease